MEKKKLIRITTVPQSFQTLLQGQIEFIQHSYDVIVISSDSPDFEKMIEEQGSPRYYKVELTRKITPLKDIKALFVLIKIFRKEKPFIVHTHTPKAGLIGMLAAKIACVPHRLHTVAGMPLLIAKGKKRIILDIVEKLTYAAATKVYPNSLRMRDIIENLHFTKPDKLKVIGKGSSNGIDTLYFSRDAVIADNDARVLYESLKEEDVFTYGFVGRIVHDKGINEMVKSFLRIHNKFSKTRLLLVGGMEENLNPILPDVKEAILNHEAIKFVGRQDDVRPYMMAFDVFVFPSYREGFPNVVLQAGALELPQIVTDINGCNEIIEEGKNGIIIPSQNEEALYEKMEWVLNNDLSSMRKCARTMITCNYKREYIWQDLLAEYQSL